MKKYLANAALGLVSLVVGYALLEAGVRWYLYDKYTRARFPMVVTHQTLGQRPEDQRLTWMLPSASTLYWKIDENSQVVFKTEYYSNNLGLISRRDQSVERKGREFRIAVVGDSFTAALQMPVPWTDILADLLNADAELRDRFGGAVFTVYNFGQPAGGFRDFQRLAAAAKRLDPDLTVINYIEADFPRCNECFTQQAPVDDEPPVQLVSGKIAIPIPGEAESPQLSMTCEQPPVSFDNPTCRHAFSLEAPASVVENPEKLALLKKLIVREFLKGQLFTSWEPYALKMALGQRISLTDLRQPPRKEPQKKAPEARSLTHDEQLAQAARVMGEVRADSRRFLVTRHPVHEDFSGEKTRRMTDDLMAYDPSISVIDMRGLLPADTSAEERYSWYCLPHDGHMSQKGGYVYARAMYALLKERLLAEPPARQGGPRPVAFVR